VMFSMALDWNLNIIKTKSKGLSEVF